MIKRYTISTIGMFLVAVGVVLGAYAQLGISGINAPAYAFEAKFGTFSFGTYNIAFFVLCMFVQMLILGKKFKAIDLLQMPANFLLGFFFDICMKIFAFLNGLPVLGQYSLLLASCVVTALGISLEVSANAWMLPADITVRAFAIATKKNYDKVKLVFDCSLLGLSALLCFIFFGNILGPEGKAIIGIGTVIASVLVGPIIKFFLPITDKIVGSSDKQ